MMISRGRRIAVIVPAFAGFIILAAFSSTAFAMVFDRPTSTSCGFGVGPGQVARLSILNNGEDVGLVIDWKFLAEDHRELAGSREAVTIAPGRMLSFDIDGDEVQGSRDRFNRIQMRAVMYSLGGPDTFERNAGVSIEVFDKSTGRSALFLGPAAVKGCSNNL